jgi:succinate dehydrogenase / fumarate reductase, cytochrome b subunit
MTWVLAFVDSSIGKKAIMAVTGLVFLGFLMGHLAGNLLVFKGPAALNAYAEGLRHIPALLWAARLTLIGCVALHVWAATSLTLANLRARPVGYCEQQDVASTYASRTMVWSGPLLGLFVGYHLAHLTLGVALPHEFAAGDVFRNVVSGFQHWPVAAFYVVAMLALGLHLYHGVWSMLQSLGLNHPRINRLRKIVAAILAVLIAGGNCSIPVAILLGIVR